MASCPPRTIYHDERGGVEHGSAFAPVSHFGPGVGLSLPEGRFSTPAVQIRLISAKTGDPTMVLGVSTRVENCRLDHKE
jgi:hypothetical protein